MEIKKLWKNNKFLFLLLLPLVVIIFFKDLIFEYLVGSSRKAVRETEEKDKKLKAQADEVNQKAEDERKAAADIEEDIQNIEVDEDWHKRRK